MSWECWDDETNVGHPDHEERVLPNGDCQGICARCGEICDLAACRVMARLGNAQCIAKLKEKGFSFTPAKH